MFAANDVRHTFDVGQEQQLLTTLQILYPVVTLAILASGCCWTGANPANTCFELQHHLKLSGARTIVTTHDLLSTVTVAVDKLGGGVDIVILSDILQEDMAATSVKSNLVPKLVTLHDLRRDRDATYLWEQLAGVDENSAATLMATSGSTGLPKLAQRTHKALVAETRAIEDNNQEKPYEVRRLYCTPAIWGAYPFPEMVINSLRLGIPSYFIRQFEEQLVSKICKDGVTEIMAVPHVLSKILDQVIETHTQTQIQSLRMVVCAGAPLAPALAERFMNIFDVPPRVVQVWGLTECGHLTHWVYPESDKTGSVGRPVSGCDIRVRGADGTWTTTDQGELWVKGSQLMKRYLGNEAATAETLQPDGWFKTGDIGYLNGGKVYIVDRLKDIIKVDGFVVSPTELENALHHCPGIEDVAAVRNGNISDEHPVIHVVPAGNDAPVSDIEECLHSRLSGYKVDKCEVKLVDSIPRNRGGKILRSELMQKAESDS